LQKQTSTFAKRPRHLPKELDNCPDTDTILSWPMTGECILYCDPELIVVDSRRLQLFSEHETHVPPPPPPKEDRDCDRVGKSDYPAHFPAGELHTTSEAAMTPRELSGAMFNDSGIMAWSAAEIQLRRTTGEQLSRQSTRPFSLRYFAYRNHLLVRCALARDSEPRHKSSEPTIRT
jgi:hypothetical protein